MSLLDSNIRHYNNIIIVSSSRTSAEKLWRMGKELGLSTEDNDNLLVDKRLQFEDRDRLAMSEKEAKKVLL